MAIFIPLVTKFDPKGLQGAQRALANFQNFAVDVGRVAAAAISAVAVASVRQASQFETSIAKVEGLVGITGDELDQLASATRRLGIETGKGAIEAAEGLFVITSSGLRGADAIEALELSLKASTAGLGETEAIARAVSGAMNAYGADVIDAADATDVIVATARAGNFETSAFAASIGRVLPFAVQAGASLEDMGGAVALLTRTNTDAGQSVTQMSALFRAFVVPTEEAKKALDNVGLSAEDMRNAIASEGLPAALDMLDEKLGGNREQLGRLLGSSEAASAAFQILDADSQTIAETFGVVNDAAGMTQEAFEVMQDTAENKFAVAMATAKDSLLNIGSAILDNVSPHLDSFILWMQDNGPTIEQGFIRIFDAIDKFITSEVLANMIQSFADMWPEIEDTIESLGNLVLALSPLLEGTLDNILPMIRDMASIMADIGFFVDEAVGAFGGWESDSPSFIRMLELQLNPMLRIKEALSQLAELFDRAREAFNRFTLTGGAKNLNLGGLAQTSTVGRLAAGFLAGPQTESFPMSGRAGEPPSQRSTVAGNRFNSFQARRAAGGPVTEGVSYLVGEMGPEVFTPGNSGDIIGNDKLGGTVYNITVNAGMGAGSGTQLGEQIVTAIKRYERSSGPVFVGA